MGGSSPELEPLRRLVAELFRQCALKLVICQQGCQPHELEFIKRWETLAKAEQGSFDLCWTRWLLAYQDVKQTLHNPDNLRALLVSEVSHTPELEWPGNSGPRCFKCGAQVDHDKRDALLARIQKGFGLNRLRRPLDGEILIGTHLTEEEVCRFTGHEVNFSRVLELVKRRYDELALV